MNVGGLEIFIGVGLKFDVVVKGYIGMNILESLGLIVDKGVCMVIVNVFL